jgi:hypothetical protein
MKACLQCVVGLLIFAAPAIAEVSATCEQPHEIDKYQLLRKLSLDLRGRVPSYEEYVALDAKSGVSVDIIRGWLSSDEFRLVMRRFHEELFWPNVSNAGFAYPGSSLSQLAVPNAFVATDTGKRLRNRGHQNFSVPGLGAQCGDFEQTHFLPDSGFMPDPAFVRHSTYDGGTKDGGVVQEGWRYVKPYWSPTQNVKVCAYDALENETVKVSAKVTVNCGAPEGDARAECGCGPGLKFCFGPRAAVQDAITASMREQMMLMVDRATTGGRPYTELLLSREAPVNGPLVHFRKYLGPHYNLRRLIAIPDATEPLPEISFDEQSWQWIDRGSDLHAGVLTTPAYLTRFQTNKGRGNRFRIDFECEPFVPPSKLETAADGCSETAGDLTQRCTCRYCHRQLEPLSGLWGQFMEAGLSQISNVAAYPRLKSDCIGSKSVFCNRFYVTNPSADNPGSLIVYQYASAHPDVASAIAEGPRKRANEIISDGTFARCAVKRAWSNLLKRDMRVVGESTDELATLAGLADGFKDQNYDMKWLIEQIVTQRAYRSVR